MDFVDKMDHHLFADAVLVATPRRPEMESLNLEAARLQVDERGAILENEHLQTTVHHILAMGDVKGGMQFTYISQDDYQIVKDCLFGEEICTAKDREPIGFLYLLIRLCLASD